MGTDMFLTLHLWHEPGTILRLAGICAFGRSEQDGEDVFAPQREFLSKTYPDARIATITLPGLVDISSTQLRELLARERGSEYLLPSVYGYILMNRLYGTYPCLKRLELPELRACSYSMIRHKRVAHVMALEQKAVKLLHSKTGACMARYVFGEPDEVYEAIFWHTTGKADMALLDKILYMADYIEPNRDFEGVERLRKLAYTDLDQAMLLGVKSTIREMEERGVPVHINTIQARQWLLDRGVKLEE